MPLLPRPAKSLLATSSTSARFHPICTSTSAGEASRRHNGLLPPQVAQSYSQHLADADSDEDYNIAVCAAAVDMETFFDQA